MYSHPPRVRHHKSALLWGLWLSSHLTVHSQCTRMLVSPRHPCTQHMPPQPTWEGPGRPGLTLLYQQPSIRPYYAVASADAILQISRGIRPAVRAPRQFMPLP